MRRLRGCLLLLAVLSGTNCYAQDGLKGLRDYLKQYKYVLFVPPRQNAAVNTIVDYSSGFESIVSSRCIPADRVRPSPPAPVGLADHSGTLDRTVGFEGSFARALAPNIDLQGAYN